MPDFGPSSRDLEKLIASALHQKRGQPNIAFPFDPSMLANAGSWPDRTYSGGTTLTTVEESLAICRKFTIGSGVTLNVRQRGLFVFADEVDIRGATIDAIGNNGSNAVTTTPGAGGTAGIGGDGSSGGTPTTTAGGASSAPSTSYFDNPITGAPFSVVQTDWTENFFDMFVGNDSAFQGITGGRAGLVAGGGSGGSGGGDGTRSGGDSGAGSIAYPSYTQAAARSGLVTVGGTGNGGISVTLAVPTLLVLNGAWFWLWAYSRGGGGSGGGAGAGTGAVVGGGGGGGAEGGAPVCIIANKLLAQGATIDTSGGVGGNGANNGGATAGGGGGAGAGAGPNLALTRRLVGTAPTQNANGGLGGNGASAGGAPGTAGGTGGVGGANVARLWRAA